MDGIRYLVDDKGEKKAVVIDLDVYADVWEDIHDILVVESRKKEPRVKWQNLKKELSEK